MIELLTLPFALALQLVRFVADRQALVAENLFLRQQLKLYLDRQKRPRRATNGQRLSFVLLSKLFNWRDALVVVKPETLIKWHSHAFRLLWRWKSRRGRPPIPAELRRLVRGMAKDNPLWGQERIAAELLLKLGIRVSPRTVRKYMPKPPPNRNQRQGQSWSTFLRNHGKAILACDFCTAVTLRFQVLYVFVTLNIDSRKILHINVTSHPTAAWTLQQIREALPWENEYRWMVHDRDSIYSQSLDRALKDMGLTVCRTPPRAPLANAFCERVIGTLRRECLDHVIPMSEQHLRRLLKEWVEHYNHGRPHSSLGPGLPDPPPGLPVTAQPQRHQLPTHARVTYTLVLGGLHHECRLEFAGRPAFDTT